MACAVRDSGAWRVFPDVEQADCHAAQDDLRAGRASCVQRDIESVLERDLLHAVPGLWYLHRIPPAVSTGNWEVEFAMPGSCRGWNALSCRRDQLKEGRNGKTGQKTHDINFYREKKRIRGHCVRWIAEAAQLVRCFSETKSVKFRYVFQKNSQRMEQF